MSNYAANYSDLDRARRTDDQLRNRERLADGLERRDRWIERRASEVLRYWDPGVRLQMARLVGLANWGIDVADYPDRTPEIR